MDLIRSGKAPEVIRRKGAEGNLPLPLEDKIEILALLAAAPEAGPAREGAGNLARMGPAEIRRVMASPQTAPEVLRFAAEQLCRARRTEGNTALEPQPSGRIPRSAATEAAPTCRRRGSSLSTPASPELSSAVRPEAELIPQAQPSLRLNPPTKKRRLKFWPSWRQVRRLRI